MRLEDYIFSRSIKNFMLTVAERYRALYHGVVFEFVPIGNGSSMEALLADGDIDVGVLVQCTPAPENRFSQRASVGWCRPGMSAGAWASTCARTNCFPPI